jgi:hypothetical protein
MARKEIPARVETTCDRCGNIRETKSKSWALSGKLSMSCNGLDYQGCAVGPGDSFHFEFCDACYNAARMVVAGIQKEPKP